MPSKVEGEEWPIFLMDQETQDYYWKVSKGQIPERSYESWGPDSEEEEAYWMQWWHATPIFVPFNRIFWDYGWTGRGVRKNKKRGLERMDLVGPKGEKLDLDTGTITDKPVKPVKAKKAARGSPSPRSSKWKKLASAFKAPYGHFDCQ